MIPLPPDGPGSLAFWRTQIKAAQDVIEQQLPLWNANAQRYVGRPPGAWRRATEAQSADDVITVNKDFALVEQKKALLFFQSPDVLLTPMRPGLDDAVRIFEAVVNHTLGPDGVDAMRMMREMLFDLLCPAGIGVTKIGYTAVIDPDQPITLDPGTPPAQTPLGAPGVPPQAAPQAPIPTLVPNVIHEQYFWARASPAKLLVPPTFRGSDFDEAPWLGLEFLEDRTVAIRRWGLPDDFRAQVDDTHRIRATRATDPSVSADQVRGYEIWYKASRVDPQELHPEAIHRLVLLDGWETPVAHDVSPYQTRDNAGRITGGMIGFPIHVCTLRVIADSAFPPSDSTISRVQVDELSRGRTQMIRQRERAIPMRLVDLGAIGGEAGLKKIERNLHQGLIPVTGLEASNPPIQAVQQAGFPRENFQFNDVIAQDVNEYWALGANQRGQETDTSRTATELQIMAQASATRLDAERATLLRWYIAGVRKLASLIQLFADRTQYVAIVGPDLEGRLEAWDKTKIQGTFAFSAKPDSAIRLDANVDRRQTLELYNLTAKDPFVNRQELARLLATKYHLDPTKLLRQPDPPHPPAPSVSVSVSAESLDPRLPQFPLIVELLQQGGYQLSPQAIQQAQTHAQFADRIMGSVAQPAPPVPRSPMTAHGGAADRVEPISQHSDDQTGGLPGIGSAGRPS